MNVCIQIRFEVHNEPLRFGVEIHHILKFFVHKMKEQERAALGEKQSWKGSGATRQLIHKKDELMYILIWKVNEIGVRLI